MATIVGGALTENTEWTAGTYYIFGSNVSLGVYNLTLNTSGGDIIIKTAGNLQVLVDGSSTLSSTGSNKIIFTSMNDDTQGEVIQGSSGSPAIGDQSVGYINVTKNDTTVNISHAEFWYCEVTNGAVIDYGTTPIPPATGNDLILNDIKLKYCSLADGSTIDSCFIGRWRRRGFNTVDINYLSVDPTNRILQTGTKGSIIKVNGISNFNLENSYLNPTCNNLGYASIILEIGVAASTNCTIKNCLIRSGFAYGCLSLLCNSSTGTGILNVNIQNSIINLIDKTQVRPGIQVYQTSGTFNFALKDSIITNCYIGLDESGTINTWDEDYNVFYENTTNSDRSLGIHSKTIDPSLSDLPEEAIINSDFPVPNGYAVTNLTELEKTGSDTFNNLSIDEAIFSATGYRYSGTDKVTPGLNYSLSRFVEDPVVSPGAKNPVNTGQNVTIYLTGEVKFNPFEKSGVYIANPYAFPNI